MTCATRLRTLALVAAVMLWPSLTLAQASPSPAPSAAATAAPTAAPNQPEGTQPTAPPSPDPSSTGQPPAYKVYYRSPPVPAGQDPDPALPIIDEIDMNDTVFTTPSDLHVQILTTANVVSVTAETMGHSLPIPQRIGGVFTLDASIPRVPGFLRNRTYDVSFIASTAAGQRSSVTLRVLLK